MCFHLFLTQIHPPCFGTVPPSFFILGALLRGAVAVGRSLLYNQYTQQQVIPVLRPLTEWLPCVFRVLACPRFFFCRHPPGKQRGQRVGARL